MKNPPQYPQIESARAFRDFVEAQLPRAAFIGERAVQSLNLDGIPLWSVHPSVTGTYYWYSEASDFITYTVADYNENALELRNVPLIGQAPHLGLWPRTTDIIPLRFTWSIGASDIFVDEPVEGRTIVEPQRAAHVLIDLGAFTVKSAGKAA